MTAVVEAECLTKRFGEVSAVRALRGGGAFGPAAAADHRPCVDGRERAVDRGEFLRGDRVGDS
jgi:hypothetical protein